LSSDRQPALFGKDIFGDPVRAKVTSMLSKRFIVPPFSVLDARQGYWQERKSAWINLGIQSELGRGNTNNPGSAGDLRADTGHGWVHFDGDSRGAVRGAFGGIDGSTTLPGSDSGWGASSPEKHYREKEKRLTRVASEKERKDLDDASRKILMSGRQGKPSVFGIEGNISEASGTSIFDPVLCELVYTWFCPEGGLVLDPFAGGSVRGIVAALLGYCYWGCELAAGQIAANITQAKTICPDNIPTWITGDSRDELGKAPMSDLVFTCPPYGNLERYSDNPRDLSTMEYPVFIQELEGIFRLATDKLKQNRFAVVVIGDFRDKRGCYNGFVADTVQMFRGLGLRVYNDAVLVTAVGSLPLRVSNQFVENRKLGKTHQNVLVFLKGNVPDMSFPANVQ